MQPPQYYNLEKAGQLYRPDVPGAMAAGSSAGLSPAASDSRKIMLVLVDVQVDFVHPDGSLSVPGAVEDLQRTLDWLYRHTGQVSQIAASLDSHLPLQIFSPTWWIDAQGNHPQPFTEIHSEQVQAGQWLPAYEKDWSIGYLRKLEDQARKALMIWPYHTLIGTQGHTLMPALYEAIAYHSAAREVQPYMLIKGSIPKTEHYSMLEPEVKVPGHPQGSLNMEFLDLVAQHDLVYIAGQAKSHCVLETVTSMMRHFAAEHPAAIHKLRVLIDCMSAVAHPEIDFDTLAEETLAGYADQGLHLVRSSDSLG